nr:hypothetical protein [Candidatus Sigynarchaeota archaeon]
TQRKFIFKLLPLIYDKGKNPVIHFFGRVWLSRYRTRCKSYAKRIAAEIKAWQQSGYKVLGIIAMDDSPTCGATRTVDLLVAIPSSKENGMTLADWISPSIEKMSRIIPSLLVPGRGIFLKELAGALETKHLNIAILGFNPWNTHEQEVARIMQNLEIARTKL